MNKIVQRELEKIRANIDYNDNTTYIYIPKSGQLSAVDLQVDHNYNIYVEDYILHEPSNFSLSTNWNKGVVPSSKYLNICVISKMKDMICVDGCGWDNINNVVKADCYTGLWLPQSSIHVVKEI